MTRPFREWVDTDGLSAEEVARLERVHELLLEVGPPAELPPRLAQPPAPAGARVIPFPARHRGVVALVAAAAVAAAAFGGGYAAGTSHGMHVTQVVALQGAPAQLASLRVGSSDAAGNTPMELTVKGLPMREHGYYELFVIEKGKPSYPCTGFRMTGSQTTVRFTVPYELRPGTQLAVTFVQRGKVKWPGRIVMRSV